MSAPRILIAGIGNIFLGDDAFGVEVVQRLARHALPQNVRLVDFGIRGFDLAFALLDGYDQIILLDAAPRGGRPGTLYKIQPDLDDLDKMSSETMALDTHGMNPLKVLAMAKNMGGDLSRIVIIGCEPAELGEPDEGRIGLSDPVMASVDEAVAMVEMAVRQSIEADEKRREGGI